MKSFPSPILYIIAKNEKAILKMVASPPPHFSFSSIPGIMRAGIYGWHTFAVEWHVREPFAGVLEGEILPSPSVATRRRREKPSGQHS